MSALQASVHSVVPRMCQRVPERGSVISILFAAIPLSSGELDAPGKKNAAWASAAFHHLVDIESSPKHATLRGLEK